jgi:hypothetical protein
VIPRDLGGYLGTDFWLGIMANIVGIKAGFLSGKYEK